MKKSLLLVIVLSSSALCVSSAVSQSPSPCCVSAGKDFPKVGGNYGNQNYSSLAQITTKNLAQLGGAWHLNLEGGSAASDAAPQDDAAAPPAGGRGGRGGQGGGAAGGQQSTVVAVDGVLYAETSQGNLYAIDGKTGQTKWSYKPGFGTQLRRGAAVGGGMVFTAGGGKHISALDQKTGKVVWVKQLDTNDGSGGTLKTAITYYNGMIYFGNADAQRGIAYALDAKTGNEVWHFYGPADPADTGNNNTWGGDEYKTGGASPWMHPAIDPQLGLVYWTFGNARGGAPTDGSGRPGTNLYANSLVAINAKTGKMVWYFQSVHHDIWDMDNVMAPVLADVPVAGKTRKIVVYGSKVGMYYVLDRTNGKPITPIVETPMPQEPIQNTWPTQPIPQGDAIIPMCPDPNGPNRAPPNYKVGCLFTPHLDFPVVQSPGTGGGMVWNAISFDPQTRLIYTGAGFVNSGHVQHNGGVGFRPLGEDRSGKIVAFNPATHKIVWQKFTDWSLAHGNGILTTAGGVMFIGQPDGLLIAMDIKDGKQLWQWQTGAGVHTSPISYEVDGQQYVAVFAGGNGLPYNSPRGDDLWAFKVGGAVAQAKTPTPPDKRQPIQAAAVEGSAVNNTVMIARNWAGTAPAPTEALTQNSMAPQNLRVLAGTTVTFTNPQGNKQPHCVTQFFEGLFSSPPLQPGQSFTYTFTKPGEYFYNDCTSPQTTGKVVVY